MLCVSYDRRQVTGTCMVVSSTSDTQLRFPVYNILKKINSESTMSNITDDYSCKITLCSGEGIHKIYITTSLYHVYPYEHYAVNTTCKYEHVHVVTRIAHFNSLRRFVLCYAFAWITYRDTRKRCVVTTP